MASLYSRVSKETIHFDETASLDIPQRLRDLTNICNLFHLGLTLNESALKPLPEPVKPPNYEHELPTLNFPARKVFNKKTGTGMSRQIPRGLVTLKHI